MEKSCANCKQLKIINKVPVYAECQLTKRVFLLWESGHDTRKNVCDKHIIGVNPLAYVTDINVGNIENTRVLDYSESKEASE